MARPSGSTFCLIGRAIVFISYMLLPCTRTSKEACSRRLVKKDASQDIDGGCPRWMEKNNLYGATMDLIEPEGRKRYILIIVHTIGVPRTV